MTIASSPPKTSVNNLANQLTASRLVLAVILFILIPLGQWIACIIIFALAAVTDWLDGIAARKLNLVSSFGRMFDPLVDKVIVGGAFIMLIPLEPTLAPWMVALIVGREFIVTGIRGFMEQQGIPFGADWLGKVKMILQCCTLFGIFLALELSARWSEPPAAIILTKDILIWAMVIATALSGLQYIFKAAKSLKNS